MQRTFKAGLIALSLSALPVMAQQAPAGMEVMSSQAGKVQMAGVIKASAVVTAIDKGTRTITLKNSQGNLFDVVAGDEVRNFDQIKVTDEVFVAYARALSLAVNKSGGVVRERAEASDAARAEPGQKPQGIVGKRVHIVANVVAVDPKASTITLKGPKGNLVELAVQNPDHFKVVKKGDQVDVDYSEAVAISVEPAPAKPAKTKKK